MQLLQLVPTACQALITACFVGVGVSAAGQDRPPAAAFDFQGRLLVAVSDADMVASAYSDGKLGAAQGADALSVIRLGRSPAELRAVAIGVSNSVTGPPASVAVTPDGRYAIVAELRGPRPAGKAAPTMGDLPDARGVFVIDLADPDHPKVVQRLEGTERANSVSINATGSLVALAFSPRAAGQSPLTVYQFSGGRLSAPATPAIPGWTPGDDLLGAEFHPKENTLALLNGTKPALSFARVATAGGISLTSLGNAVGIGKGPYLAKFTPDGRHVVVNATFTGPDALLGGFGSPRGAVLVVRLAAERAADGSPRNQLVSHAETGVVPEGLTISPDGRWVVTTNLERSSAPLDSPQQGFFSSLTLLQLTPETGLLERVGDFALDGILPEAAVFDNSSRYLAVTVFDHYDHRRPGGSIDFWRISGDFFDSKRTELVQTGYSVPVTRGAHSLVIVR